MEDKPAHSALNCTRAWGQSATEQPLIIPGRTTRFLNYVQPLGYAAANVFGGIGTLFTTRPASLS